ncbi:MAG: hypothetical protein AAF960_17945 [Bacteroidota bacterium]
MNSAKTLVRIIFFTLLVGGFVQIGHAQCPNNNDTTFTANGTFTVPTGVTEITIVAIGAKGGDSGNNINMGIGGGGDVVSGTFTVSPGDVLNVTAGTVGTSNTPSIGTDDLGAGGGGGSGVVNSTSSTLIVIAAGGGGAGFVGGGNYNNGGDGGTMTIQTTAGTAAGGTGNSAIPVGGGGGGGFGVAGSDGAQGGGGGAGTLTSAGAGGTGSLPGGQGLGGGGGAANAPSALGVGGGGGGGFIGGDAGGFANPEGAGGVSFYNDNLISGAITDNATVNTSGDGSVQICWATPAACTIDFTVSNLSSCTFSGDGSRSSGCSFITGDINVTFANAPNVGSILITGDASANVNFANLPVGATSASFSDVLIKADGDPIEITASFTNNIACTVTKTVGTAPAGCAPCGQGAIQIVSSGDDPSLAIINGQPAISYRVNSGLAFVRAATTDGTAWGSPIVVDNSGNAVGSFSTLLTVDGFPAIVYANSIRELKYVRATDANGTNWGTPVTVATDYGSFPRQTGFAIVDGNPAIAYEGFNVGLRYVRATDPQGTTWGTPTTLDGGILLGSDPSLVVVDGFPAIAYFDFGNTSIKYIRALDASGATWGTIQVLESGANISVLAYISLAIVNGQPAVSYSRFGNSSLAYVRANDAAGSSWPTSIEVDNSGSTGLYTSLKVINGFPAISYYDFSTGRNSLRFIQATDQNGSNWGTSIIGDIGAEVGYNTSLQMVGDVPVIAYEQNNGDIRFVAIETCCNITDITTANLSACTFNANTATSTFTADVTVTFTRPPSTGTLELTGDGTASVAVTGLTTATTHTFSGVTLPSDGGSIALTATFSDLSTCTFSKTNAGTAPSACPPVINTSQGNCDPAELALDFGPATDGIEANNVVIFNNKLFFAGEIASPDVGDELASFDGTNIVLEADVRTGSTGSAPEDLIVFNNKLYFEATDGVNDRQLWVFDGTTASLVQIINPTGNALIRNPLVFNNKLYFVANDGTNGFELWVFDGTTASLVQNIGPSNADGLSLETLTIFNNQLYFGANDGINGNELWVFDGTTASIVQDLNPTSSSSPRNLFVFNNQLYFTGRDGSGTTTELFAFNGTTITNLGIGIGRAPGFTVFKDKVYFRNADATNGRELWVFDGTTASVVADLNPGTSDSNPTNFTIFKDQLYFEAEDPIHGRELWLFDGSSAGLLQDIRPGTGSSDISEFIVFQDRLYFVANDGITGDEFWSIGDNCQSDVVITPPIPTMSQWGVFIFGLLVLNVGLILLIELKKVVNH